MLDKLKNIFSKNKNPLDMPLNKINESKIKLDIQIKKLEGELSKIDNQVTALFEKAKISKNKSEELTIATKIKTLSQRKKQLQNSHALINKQVRFVDNLWVLKENEVILKSTPMWDVLKDMSPENLEKHLIDMKIDSENVVESLNNSIDLTTNMLGAASEEYDEGIVNILDTIHAVKEGELDIDDAKKIVSTEKSQEKEDDFEEELDKLLEE
ncbi:MAG: hypothetical protein HF967_05480 [Methanosarcinales archaeon]|nr:hypothetical protein [Methanosarcinales archaeon]